MALMLIMPMPAKAQDNPLAGYTIGLNVGYPVVTGDYYSGRSGPIVGLAVGSPYGFALGPFNMSIGAGVEAALMDAGTEIGAFATVNTTVYTTPAGPISVYGGAGYYGGAGFVGGAYFDYMVPNMPLVVKPYVRATVMSSAAVDADGNPAPSGWINIGIMALYDISTLF